MTDEPRGPRNDRQVRAGAREAALVALVGLLAAAAVLGVTVLRDRLAGDRFDLVRWERTTVLGQWAARLGAPLRRDPPPDNAIRRYFAAPPESADRHRLENAVEAAVVGRVDAVLQGTGLQGRLPVPGSVFPPVAFELAASPRVLVTSPRSAIRRLDTALLRPDLTTEDGAALERKVEAADRGVSALVVASGGVAAYPAVVFDRDSYSGTVSAVAHEWLHHYLSFYPLGVHYFDSGDTTAINETVADLVGDEIASTVVGRWGDPTRGTPRASSTPLPRPGLDVDATLRDLRLEVDRLLAAGRVDEAEARMEAERLSLADQGVRIRRINQAYFAWYGTYAARPDAVDPLGGQLREIRDRAGSLRRFVELVRETSSRAEVERLLAELRAGGR